MSLINWFFSLSGVEKLGVAVVLIAVLGAMGIGTGGYGAIAIVGLLTLVELGLRVGG